LHNQLFFWKQFVPEIVGHVGGFVCIYGAVSTFVFPTQIVGRSMFPTIQAGNWVLVSTIQKQKIERGDVIVLMSPTTANERIIKRVVGTEGDVVQPRSISSTVEIPRGHIWIEGDNSELSIDSNAYGPVPISLVTGKARAVIFPFTNFEWLGKQSLSSQSRILKYNNISNSPTIPYENLSFNEKVK